MKAYVIATGAVFALLTLAHLWRIIWEKPELVRDPLFLAITAMATVLAVWAGVVLRRAD